MDQHADELEARVLGLVVVRDVAAAEVDRAAARVGDAVEVVDVQADRARARASPRRVRGRGWCRPDRRPPSSSRPGRRSPRRTSRRRRRPRRSGSSICGLHLPASMNAMSQRRGRSRRCRPAGAADAPRLRRSLRPLPASPALPAIGVPRRRMPERPAVAPEPPAAPPVPATRVPADPAAPAVPALPLPPPVPRSGRAGGARTSGARGRVALESEQPAATALEAINAASSSQVQSLEKGVASRPLSSGSRCARKPLLMGGAVPPALHQTPRGACAAACMG